MRLRSPIDLYSALILGMAVLASILPCRGETAVVLGWVVKVAVGLLFFLYGARLSRRDVLRGFAHWRLQGAVLATTFVVFPLLGLAAHVLVPTVLSPGLYRGVLFLCLLPSTVQSSIVFTAIAGGNVAAAICAASASSVLGIFLTPLLVSLTLAAGAGGIGTGSIGAIVLQLLLPFVVGQALSGRLAPWLGRHKRLTNPVDRGSILLIVYTAFSESVVDGVWHRLGVHDLAAVIAVDTGLLAIGLALTTFGSRWLGFLRDDEITIVFCGSKKSLANGVPMLNVLFPPAVAGVMVIPLILFHQIQLMACAALARRYAVQRAAGPALQGD